jgi:uncharacterized membrane protein
MSELLVSRKFWVTILTLIVLLVAAFINPGFELDTEHAAGLAVVAVSYLLGVAYDPGPGGWRGWIKSRKWWAAVIGFLVVWLDAFGIGLPEGLTSEMLITICGLIGGYIGGVAIESRTKPYPGPAG